MSGRRRGSLAALTALVVATAAVGAATTATATTTPTPQVSVDRVTRDGVRVDVVHVPRPRVLRRGHGATRSDFDGDGIDDLAVGGQLFAANGPSQFGPQGQSGAVEVSYSSTPRNDVVIGEQRGGGCDCFGSVLATGDFNGDGFDDLAVGDSDEVIHGDPHRGHGGGVWVLPGSSSGLLAARALHFTQDTPGVPGVDEDQDWFGAALAAGDVTGDGFDDLAVGAPNEKVGKAVGAGVVTLLHGSAHGLTGRRAVTFGQNSRGVPGVAERGDAFSSSLAIGRVTADRYADLVVGIPYENFAGHVFVASADPSASDGTGAVTLFRGSRTGVSFAHVSTVSGHSVARAAMKAHTMRSGTYLWEFGDVLATGDVDGDGLDEVVVGDCLAESEQTMYGGAVVTLKGRSGWCRRAPAS